MNYYRIITKVQQKSSMVWFWYRCSAFLLFHEHLGTRDTIGVLRLGLWKENLQKDTIWPLRCGLLEKNWKKIQFGRFDAVF